MFVIAMIANTRTTVATFGFAIWTSVPARDVEEPIEVFFELSIGVDERGGIISSTGGASGVVAEESLDEFSADRRRQRIDQP
jgi:hypothetical protein